jgi:type IV pilus assembly protein PilC
MPDFNYEGSDRAGKRVKGKLSAASEGELRVSLRAQGIRPTRISQAGGMDLDLFASFKSTGVYVSPQEVVTFTRQLQLLLSSGVPLIQGLELLAEQSSPSFQSVILAIKEKVSGGGYLWETLSQYPTVFPKLYVAMIRAGEASGALDQVLKRLGRYLEDSERIGRLVKGAMSYPIIVMSIGSGVVALMVIFVIPQFEAMLKSTGKALPAPTQFLIDISHFVSGHLAIIITVIVVGGYSARRYLKTDEGKAFVARLVFKLPVFGPLSQKSAVARFARTLQTLSAAGLGLLDAIDICKQTIDNVVMEDAMKTIRSEIEGGKSLGAVVNGISVFPKMASHMIAIGESTGNLDKMLEKIADMYEADAENLAAGLGKAIEPFVIVILGTMVGGIMIAMYLPMFTAGGGE